MKRLHPHAVALAATLTALSAHADPTPGQISAAANVYVGDAECEFKQHVSLRPIAGRPGHFELRFKKASYTMVPQETTTGAVRLEDQTAGLVWIQIPAKSMLLNSRLGQRLVDACLHAEQRAEVAAAATRPPGIGIGIAATDAAPAGTGNGLGIAATAAAPAGAGTGIGIAAAR